VDLTNTGATISGAISMQDSSVKATVEEFMTLTNASGTDAGTMLGIAAVAATTAS
jgi:hypothetical protein